MAEGLGAKLKAIFSEFDSNKEHVIPREKLTQVLKSLDASWTEAELDTLFETADKDGNGVIDYNEFVDFVCYMDEDPDAAKSVAAVTIFVDSAMTGECLKEFKVAPGESVSRLRTATEESTKSKLKLFFKDQVLEDSKSIAEVGICDQDRVTAVIVKTASIVNLSFGECDWHTPWQAPGKVVQLAVGPYSAYVLLDDGTVWSIGRFTDEPLVEQWRGTMENGDLMAFNDPDRPTTTLCSVKCLNEKIQESGSKVCRIEIEYGTLLAITTSGDVWACDFQNFGGSQLISVLYKQSEAQEQEAEELEAQEEEDEIVKRVDLLCGHGIVSIQSNQIWGVAITSAGKAFVLANWFMAKSEMNGTCWQWFEEQLDALLEEGTLPPLCDIDLGGRQAVKCTKIGTMCPCYLLLNDGSVLCVPGHDCALRVICEGQTARLMGLNCVTQADGAPLSGIVDVAVVDNSVFCGVEGAPEDELAVGLDRNGRFWNLTNGKMLAVGEEHLQQPVTRFAGEMPIASRGEKDETGFVLTSQIVAPWLHAECIGSYHSGRYFSAVWLERFPEEAEHVLEDSRKEVVTATFAGRVSRGEIQIPEPVAEEEQEEDDY